jgi:ectoine hydroxylase-related dioxygenase (phytanoyl-CoA dioxygenase family)
MVSPDKLRQLAEDGWCLIPNVISPEQADGARKVLWAAVAEDERNGGSPRIPGLDPNEKNIRVFNLVERDPVFVELIQHPVAIALVEAVLGEAFTISNFSANIALPGSGSMEAHSDQGLVAPEPWLQPWSVNIIWCLDDAHDANGATRFMPGSHHFQSWADVPDDLLARMRAFEAPKGWIIAMDGRIWHTSGANVTEAEERALLFGYYARAFLRPQQNWTASLSPETVEGLSPQMRGWLGLEAIGNRSLAKFLFARTAADN